MTRLWLDRMAQVEPGGADRWAPGAEKGLWRGLDCRSRGARGGGRVPPVSGPEDLTDRSERKH